MKRFFLVALTLCLAVITFASALAMEGDYRWREYPITVTKIDDKPMWVPAGLGKDEYAVAISMTVEEALWKDKALCDELFQEIRLLDAQNNAYVPGASMSGVDTPLLIYTFCVPKSVPLDELTLRMGESGGAAEGDGTATLTASDGSAIALTPLEAGSFQAQADRVIVHTRIGTTVHSSGSKFRAGSGLSLSNMRDTQQYKMLMIAFAYASSLDFDKTADELGKIGETAVLTLDGTEYSPQVAWVTEDMACYIFDCPQLPGGTARFAVDGNTLTIQP